MFNSLFVLSSDVIVCIYFVLVYMSCIDRTRMQTSLDEVYRRLVDEFKTIENVHTEKF
jgi:hypothetical protein